MTEFQCDDDFQEGKHIWYGIFDNFNQARVVKAKISDENQKVSRSVNSPFDASRWIEHQRELARKHQKKDEKSKERNSLLVELCRKYYRKYSGKLVIIDFGGGLGLEFLKLKLSEEFDKQIKFHVVETEQVCKVGSEFFESESDIFFRQDFPENIDNVKVFHASDSIHYIENWKDYLAKAADLNPDFMALGGVTAGDIPTFVTLQHYYGSWIPVRFWARDELVCFLEKLGYECIVEQRFKSCYFGEIQKPPMSNFPKSHRLEQKTDFIFKRKK